MFGLNPIPLYTIVALAVLNIALGFGWWVTGVRLDSAEAQVTACAAKHNAFVEQVKASGRAAEDRARAKEREQKEIADATSKGWAAALAVVRADADQRVRLAASRGAGSGGVSVTPLSADRVDVGTQEPLPAPERIIADCAEDTLKLVWLQHWIKETRDGQE